MFTLNDEGDVNNFFNILLVFLPPLRFSSENMYKLCSYIKLDYTIDLPFINLFIYGLFNDSGSNLECRIVEWSGS
jgi:hypothetical protein